MGEEGCKAVCNYVTNVVAVFYLTHFSFFSVISLLSNMLTSFLKLSSLDWCCLNSSRRVRISFRTISNPWTAIESVPVVTWKWNLMSFYWKFWSKSNCSDLKNIFRRDMKLFSVWKMCKFSETITRIGLNQSSLIRFWLFVRIKTFVCLWSCQWVWLMECFCV